MALKSNICYFRVIKSKMAAKIQDGGRIFLCLLTKKLDMALKNCHTKFGACCQSVTSLAFPGVSACTNGDKQHLFVATGNATQTFLFYDTVHLIKNIWNNLLCVSTVRVQRLWTSAQHR